MFVLGVYPQPLIHLANGVASLWAGGLGSLPIPVS